MRFFLIIGIILLFASCKNPDDISPVISSLVINNQEQPYFLGSAGEEVSFVVEVKDDKQLKQIMLRLEPIQGIHHFAAIGNDSIPFLQEVSSGQFDTLLVKSISGNSQQVHFSFHLPHTINGAWKTTIGVLDNNGNYTSQIYILHIHNDNLPSITLYSVFPIPQINGVVDVADANSISTFSINGYVVDQTGLKFVKASLYKSIANKAWQKEWLFEENTENFSLSDVTIQDTLVSGTYTFEINIEDIEGWQSTFLGKIIIH